MRVVTKPVSTWLWLVTGLGGMVIGYAAVFATQHFFYFSGLVLFGWIAACASGLLLTIGALLAFRQPAQTVAGSGSLVTLAVWVVCLGVAYFGSHKRFPIVNDLASVQIRLTRGTCLGLCPAYEVEIRGDGSVRYDGYANV